MQRSFRAFLQESLTEIQLTEPDVDLALQEKLGPLSARLTTEGSSFVIAREGTEWRVFADARRADIEVVFDDQIIMDLAAGVLTLNDAICGERLCLSGPVDAIANFHDALLIYLEGLIRARGTPELLERYRAS
jgi:hypothetical protein